MDGSETNNREGAQPAGAVEPPSSPPDASAGPAAPEPTATAPAGAVEPVPAARAVREWPVVARRSEIDVHNHKDRRMLLNRILLPTGIPAAIRRSVAIGAAQIFLDERKASRVRLQAGRLLATLDDNDLKRAMIWLRMEDGVRGSQPLTSQQRLDALEKLFGGDPLADPFGGPADDDKLP